MEESESISHARDHEHIELPQDDGQDAEDDGTHDSDQP
jgi:hypothetical protein